MFSVSAKELVAALPTLKKGNTKSLLNVVHIYTLGEEAFFETTNYDVHVRQALTAYKYKDVDFVLSFTAFEKIMSGCGKTDEVEFDVWDDNAYVTISTGELSTKIATMKNGHVFPTFPETDYEDGLTFHDGTFCTGRDAVAYAVAKDDTRPALSGVYLESLDNAKFRLTGCDGFRAAQAAVVVESGPENYFYALAKNLDVIPKLYDDKKHALPLVLLFPKRLLPKELLFEYPDAGLNIWMRTVDAAYPDLDAVVPQTFSATITVTLQRLIDGVKLVTAKESNRNIQFSLEDGSLILTGAENDGIEGETLWSYGPVEIGGLITTKNDPTFIQDLDRAMHSFSAASFKSKFLQEALSKIKHTYQFDGCVLQFNGPHQPVVIHGKDDETNRAIIMPVE